MTATAAHEPTVTKRTKGFALVYNGKNWSDEFKCEHCGNARRANLNYLGSRKIVCTGTKLAIVSRERAAQGGK